MHATLVGSWMFITLVIADIAQWVKNLLFAQKVVKFK